MLPLWSQVTREVGSALCHMNIFCYLHVFTLELLRNQSYDNAHREAVRPFTASQAQDDTRRRRAPQSPAP